MGESITPTQWVTSAQAFIGCALVAGICDAAQIRLNGLGIHLGLASGLTCGLYSVFNKAGVRKYPPWTVLFSGMLIGALMLLLTQDLPRALGSSEAVAWLVALALLPTLGSVVANLEPVVATLLAFLILGEVMTGWQIVDSALVITGAVISIQS